MTDTATSAAANTTDNGTGGATDTSAADTTGTNDTSGTSDATNTDSTTGASDTGSAPQQMPVTGADGGTLSALIALIGVAAGGGWVALRNRKR